MAATVPTGVAPGRSRSRLDWTARVPAVFGAVLAVLAVICAVAAISLAFFSRSQPIRDVIPAPANLGYAAFVGVLSASVTRRKRLAWGILITYFGLQVAFDIGLLALIGSTDDVASDLRLPGWWIPSATSVNLAISLCVLVVLILARSQFFAEVQVASLRKAVGVFVAFFAAATLAGWALVGAFPGTLQHGRKLLYALQRVAGGAFDFDVTRHGHAAGWVNLLLGLGGAIAIFAALWVMLRSQRIYAAMPAVDEQRVRQLLAIDGERDSLGYFATRRDKSALFSPTGKAAITYRVVNGVSLASGDPLGDPEAWGPVIDAWLANNERQAWTPAVMGASEDGAKAYARAGLRVIELGDEAILHVNTFTLDGREMRPVRQAANRIRRAGYRVRVRRHSEITPTEMSRIIDLAASWRDTETERGFSMALGRLGDPADGRCVLIEAYDAAGREAAVLSFVPWGAAGLSLDLMRRDRAGDNGLMEFMVTELVAASARLGVTRISLNFAVFRAVFEEGARIGAGPVLRAWRSLLVFFSRWFQLESLYRSNVKYRPEWLPRFLCFEDRRDLAKVAMASGIAEGFVVVPSLRTLLRRGLARRRTDSTVTPPTDLVVDAPPVSAAAAASVVVADRGEQERVRIAKLDTLAITGIEAYPVGIERTHTCAAIRLDHPGLAADERTGDKVAIAGRIMLIRDHGGVCFATLRDASGDIQVILDEDVAGPDALTSWRATVDLGDLIGVAGEVAASRLGEVSVLASSWTMAGKCLRPMPDKHRGLSDPEARVRQRYLDLAVDPAARQTLEVRSAVLQALRGGLVEQHFIEVETPILQRNHGGANARPFVTHINAYDLKMFLRIAPELYLKRLAIGGMERIFELGRTFRNEGADATHNPEFTMLEAYQAYADYTDMRRLTQALIAGAARAAYGVPVARRPEGDVDLDGDWPVVTVHDAVAAALVERVVGATLTVDTPAEELRAWAIAAGVPVDPAWNRGQVLLECYEHLVEAATFAPTFYTDFPIEVAPLTRAHRDDLRLAERWDLVAFGMEIGTAYSELVDPIEQRRRLTAQSVLAAGGDAEAMDLDEDFLQALEYGMPPTGGLGLGVDRIVMALTGKTIRESVTFPLVRPRA
ncbi:MAG TPA: bifunctional lysylphosphatidylglycerol synthetase/lysine--tRNA ligase LysX [Micromonosporaceae bacterium]